MKSIVFARTIGPVVVPIKIRSVERRQYVQYIACITDVIFSVFKVLIEVAPFCFMIKILKLNTMTEIILH